MSSADVKEEEPGSPGFEDDVSLSPSSPRPAADDTNDEELYEDSLDLDMSRTASKVWLVKLPKYLMERWKNVDQISGKELAKVRIRNQPGNEDWKVQLILNDTPETADIPREYEIGLSNKAVESTFVFTEQDLPKYTKPTDKDEKTTAAAAKAKGKFNNRKNYFKGSGLAPNGESSNGSSPRFVPYARTIPKKTALVGTVCHECNVTPVTKDPNYANILAQRRAIESQADRPKVTFLNEMPGVNTATFSQSLRSKGTSFIKSTKKDASKSADGKATRIARNELLDILFKLFEEYDYWSMKGLRERTKQPESYLKEVLEHVATLEKKGSYVMKYTLKPEYKHIKDRQNSLSEFIERAGAGAVDNEGEDNEAEEEAEEDDDDEIEMETIL